MRTVRLLLLTLLVPMLARAATISATTTHIASNVSCPSGRCVSYDPPFIAWVDAISGNVTYYDERDGSTHPIGPGSAPAVGDGEIAFICGAAQNVCVFDPATGQTTQATSDSGDSEPSISSQLLAWNHAASPQDYAYVQVMDRSTGQTVSLPYPADSSQTNGNLVLYTQQSASPYVGLALYDHSTGSTQGVGGGSDGLVGWGFDGKHIVYSPVQGCAACTTQTRVTDLAGNILANTQEVGGTISGDWVPITSTNTLSLWRWTTGDLFSTNVTDRDSLQTIMHGSRVVYFDSGDIYAADFGSVSASTVSFSDNFDSCTSTSDLGPNWTTDGDWYCKSQRARGENTRDLALANTVGMQDTDVSALVQLDNDDMSGIVARAQGSSYYAARLRSSNYVELIRVNGNNVQVIASKAMPISQYVSYTMGLHVSGTDPVQLSVEINGSEVLSFTDSSSARLYGGFAGLMHGTGFRTQFDNFVLNGSAPAFTGGSVQPPPPPPSGSVSFSDNFDACADNADLGASWDVHGTFYCKSQRARGEESQGVAFAKTDVLTDTDVQAFVQLDSNDGSGVVARGQVGSYYGLRLRSSGAVDLVRVNNGVTTILASVAEPVANETSYTIRLRVTGANPVHLTGDFAGTTVLSYDDSSSSQLTSGDAGLLHGGPFRTQFDDFVLTGTTGSGTNPPPPPPPPPSNGPVSFSDNFDACADNADLGVNWTTDGTWYCKAQRARGESAMGLALAKTAAMTDTDVQSLVQLNSSTGSGVVARETSGHYYAARLLLSGAAQIVRVDNGVVTVLGQASASVAVNTSYRVELQVSGTSSVQLEMLFNGSPILTATDSSGSALASGLVGLLSGSDARTQFDNFAVSGTAAP